MQQIAWKAPWQTVSRRSLTTTTWQLMTGRASWEHTCTGVNNDRRQIVSHKQNTLVSRRRLMSEVAREHRFTETRAGRTSCTNKLKLVAISGLSWVEQGLTSHQTHYRSYRGRVFTDQMTEPTVSQHWRKASSGVMYTVNRKNVAVHLTL